MSIVVGVAPGHCSRSAVRLGVLLARSYEQDLVLVSVNSAAWPPVDSKVDAEYQAFLVGKAQAALDEAKALVPDDLNSSYLVRGASSARRGLLEVCRELDAMRLVVGSAPGGGDGRITLGSVSTGLLQSAGLPVALAPHGFDVPDGARLERVTAAYNGSETSAELMLGAAAIAAHARAGIRIASFAPRPRSDATARVGLNAESDVIAEWGAVIRMHTDELLGDIAQFTVQPTSVEVAVGAGKDWGAAMRSVDWKPAEVLLVGSSSLGPLARVSLGSHAAKIVRNSPVPVVLVPRRASEAYAAQVEPLTGPRL
ncbi:universal stress protein [Saxibacter everestensis]|uniref:Universal stress protein n=1 Tax=Saxibacter everestensis TaxID=2909229 RepID=A0ABY8QWS7_9MICO|nr:universal stress protein [Brevibacteriaceae bacterium ZFBP1038]